MRTKLNSLGGNDFPEASYLTSALVFLMKLGYAICDQATELMYGRINVSFG